MNIKGMLIGLGAKVSKHMPTILVVGGIATGVTAAVIAVKRTPRVHECVVDADSTLEKIKEMEDDPSAKFVVEQGETDDEPTLYAPYDADVARNDRKEVFRNVVIETTKAYALPVGLGLAAITMILVGYRMKCKALAAMTVAYNSTMAAFRTYRKRVSDHYGEDVERDIYLGKHTEVVESEDEEGNLKVEEVTTYDPCNDLVIRFDSDCPEHRNDQLFLKNYFHIVEQNLNTIYRTRRTPHFYVYELLDAIGVDREQKYAGKGWSAKTNPERGEDWIDICDNITYANEDGEIVAYIHLDIDGDITI